MCYWQYTTLRGIANDEGLARGYDRGVNGGLFVGSVLSYMQPGFDFPIEVLEGNNERTIAVAENLLIFGKSKHVDSCAVAFCSGFR